MLYRADFALEKQPEHSFMVAISRAWYNGSYNMAAKPIKSLEMHYTMIQFLIINISLANTAEATKSPKWGIGWRQKSTGLSIFPRPVTHLEACSQT